MPTRFYTEIAVSELRNLPMFDEKFEISVGASTVSAIRTSPDTNARFTFIYAPGAGSNINDPFGEYLGLRLAATGASLVRFQFPYMEAKKRRPDRPALLEETWREVINKIGCELDKLVVGGRSMGGRIASQVVAKGTQVAALALFAYPLNPPYNPAISRDGHLSDIVIPTLFCSGTRDNFATPDDLSGVAARMQNATVHELDGADHSFAVLKSSSRTRENVWEEAVDVMLSWSEGLSK